MKSAYKILLTICLLTFFTSTDTFGQQPSGLDKLMRKKGLVLGIRVLNKPTPLEWLGTTGEILALVEKDYKGNYDKKRKLTVRDTVTGKTWKLKHYYDTILIALFREDTDKMMCDSNYLVPGKSYVVFLGSISLASIIYPGYFVFHEHPSLLKRQGKNDRDGFILQNDLVTNHDFKKAIRSAGPEWEQHKKFFKRFKDDLTAEFKIQALGAAWDLLWKTPGSPDSNGLTDGVYITRYHSHIYKEREIFVYDNGHLTIMKNVGPEIIEKKVKRFLKKYNASEVEMSQCIADVKTALEKNKLKFLMTKDRY